MRRAAQNDDGTIPILTLFLNPTDQDQRFHLPAPDLPTRVLLDSAVPEQEEHDLAGREVVVAARCAVLTKSVIKPGPS